MLRIKLSLLAALASGLSGCVTGPEGLLRSHAYEGPPKSRDNVAAVFVAHSGLQTYFTLICEVDGKSYRRMGFMTSCPSVAYLLPGKHQLSLETRFGNLIGNHSYEVTVDQGRVYQIVTTLKEPRVVNFDTRAMPQGYVLTYRDIGPFFFQGNLRADAPVPIEGN
ncbi:hypothetical protein [Ideonella sp. YS5]|uniref:hypothetical protein n=1 Tax=Ideonella sp. YS5 TaxID=3453714 RepID=UPI003EE83994